MTCPLAPATGEGDDFLIHANILFLDGGRSIQDTPKTLASRSALPSKSRKIIKNKSQGGSRDPFYHST